MQNILGIIFFRSKVKDAIEYYTIMPLKLIVELTSQLIATGRQKFLKEEPFEQEAEAISSRTRKYC
jgi:hypothetical protein